MDGFGNAGIVMLAFFLLVFGALIIANMIGRILRGLIGQTGLTGGGIFCSIGLASEFRIIPLISFAIGVYRLLGASSSELAETFS
ncbi:hypothetical protein [Tsuneonella sp. HG222]